MWLAGLSRPAAHHAIGNVSGMQSLSGSGVMCGRLKGDCCCVGSYGNTCSMTSTWGGLEQRLLHDAIL